MATRSTAYEGIQKIKESAKRGSEIVRELMVYAGNDQPNRLGLLDLSRIVEEMLELLKVSISKRAVLNMDLSIRLPHVTGNA